MQILSIIMAIIISIEGNIGSGKSTLVKNLLAESLTIDLDLIFLQEPVDIWKTIKDKNGVTILEKFYTNQEKYAFSFQMMAYISRLKLLKDTVEKNPDSIIVCERSLWTDRNVFAKMLKNDGKIEDINYTIYNKWFDAFSKDFKTDGYIYLKTSPEICKKRVVSRNRTGENIPIEYLQKCNSYHNNWLSEEKNILILDGDTAKKNLDNSMLIDIINFINKIIVNK